MKQFALALLAGLWGVAICTLLVSICALLDTDPIVALTVLYTVRWIETVWKENAPSDGGAWSRPTG